MAQSTTQPGGLAFEQEVLKLTNEFRQKNGLKALVLDQSLEKAADLHSKNMATQDFFSHTGKDNSRPWDRAQKAGYESGFVGENIAAGYRSAKAVVDGWINSPGHRANMLNSNYNEIGLGYYFLENDTGKVNYKSYWTQVFGKGTLDSPAPKPKPTPSPTPDPTPVPSPGNVIKGTAKKDVLKGKATAETIYGLAGADTLKGRGGNDKLVGGKDNDVIIGGRGDDTIIGVDDKSTKAGAGEVDLMRGGSGGDLFVLGDADKAFYVEKGGVEGKAVILDFNRQVDTIQLNGSAGDYRLVQKGNGARLFHGTSGTPQELVADIKGDASGLSLNADYFSYAG